MNSTAEERREKRIQEYEEQEKRLRKEYRGVYYWITREEYPPYWYRGTIEHKFRVEACKTPDEVEELVKDKIDWMHKHFKGE